jgi:uncharacterized membrane protein YfcA
VAPFTPAILAMIIGAVIAAVAGMALFSRLSGARLERIILGLLLVIGIALIVEGLLPATSRTLLAEVTSVWVVAGVLFGLGIGLVSSLLGVAGGEVIIPTLILAYGADIKTAGTASLLISLPMVAVGIMRYARRGAYARGDAAVIPAASVTRPPAVALHLRFMDFCSTSCSYCQFGRSSCGPIA